MHYHLWSCLESGQIHPFLRFRTCDSTVVLLNITKDTTLTEKWTTFRSSCKQTFMKKYFQTPIFNRFDTLASGKSFDISPIRRKLIPSSTSKSCNSSKFLTKDFHQHASKIYCQKSIK